MMDRLVVERVCKDLMGKFIELEALDEILSKRFCEAKKNGDSAKAEAIGAYMNDEVYIAKNKVLHALDDVQDKLDVLESKMRGYKELL